MFPKINFMQTKTTYEIMPNEENVLLALCEYTKSKAVKVGKVNVPFIQPFLIVDGLVTLYENQTVIHDKDCDYVLHCNDTVIREFLSILANYKENIKHKDDVIACVNRVIGKDKEIVDRIRKEITGK